MTFGEDGLYWHPDHIAVYEATRAAVASLGAGAPALYYVTMPPGQMRGRARRGRAAPAAGVAARPARHRRRRPRSALPRSRRRWSSTPAPSRRASWPRSGAIARRWPAGRSISLEPAEAEALLGVEHYRRADVGSHGAGVHRAPRRAAAGDCLMDASLLDLLRCPFCGTRLDLVDNDALAREGRGSQWGVLGCQCCAFPDRRRHPGARRRRRRRAAAMHAMEAGRQDEALASLLGLDAAGGRTAARAAAGRRRHVPRGARDHQPRRGGHLLRLPVLRSHVRPGGNARPRARRRSPRAPRACIDLCGGSGHLTRVLAGRERRAGRRGRRVLLEAVAGAALHRARLRAGLLRRQPPAAVRATGASRWSCCRTRFPTSGTSACWPGR